MLSRVSSDESNSVNVLVRRAVRAALALGAAMLLASLQVQAQTPPSRTREGTAEDGRRRRHRPQQHRSDAGSHALSAQRKQRVLVRLQQAAARNAALGVVHQPRADRSVRSLFRGRSRPRGRRCVHARSLRHRGLHRHSRRAGRYLSARHEARGAAGQCAQRARGDGCHRGRQGPAVADLRPRQDRRLHQLRAEVGSRRRRRLSTERSGIFRNHRGNLRSPRVLRRRRRTDQPRQQERRLLRLRPPFGLAVLLRGNAVQAEDAAGRRPRSTISSVRSGWRPARSIRMARPPAR